LGWIRHGRSGGTHAEEIRTWPAGLPIFGLLTPLPATPLYKRLAAAGRLTRPKHWQEFIPFAMAHTPEKISIEDAQKEVRIGWDQAYSAEAIEKAWILSITSRSAIASISSSHEYVFAESTFLKWGA